MCVADVISLKQVDPWKYALRIIDLTIGKVWWRNCVYKEVIQIWWKEAGVSEIESNNIYRKYKELANPINPAGTNLSSGSLLPMRKSASYNRAQFNSLWDCLNYLFHRMIFCLCKNFA
jgi:hypothetical protein